MRTPFLSPFGPWPLLLAAMGCQKSDPSGAASPAAPPAASSLAAASPSAPPGPHDPEVEPSNAPVVRERTDVPVDGSTEKWWLEWTKPPVPDCVDAPAFETCPCAAFAFGEKGYLDLVRARPGASDERLPLSALFEENTARLRRWPVTKADSGKKPDLAELALRPIETVMKLGDYDHDGRATELVIAVGSQPCGHIQSVVVGISKSNPALHVFSSADKPGAPLVLEHASDWEKLRVKAAIDLVEVTCGDHGADTETSLHLTADGTIRAQEKTKKCPEAP